MLILIILEVDYVNNVIQNKKYFLTKKTELDFSHYLQFQFYLVTLNMSSLDQSDDFIICFMVVQAQKHMQETF